MRVWNPDDTEVLDGEERQESACEDADARADEEGLLMFGALVSPADVQDALNTHQELGKWLVNAERILATDGERTFRHDPDFGKFIFEVRVPEEIWRPQLTSEVAQAKLKLQRLARLSQEYVETSLKKGFDVAPQQAWQGTIDG